MSRVLVAYFSFTGATRRAAEAIARRLGADLEPIRDANRRAPDFFGYARSTFEGALRTSAPIFAGGKDPGGYDLVVLGCPVWASAMASPMRSYIKRERAALKRIALFCTQIGHGGESAMDEMAALCAQQPIARLALSRSDLKGRFLESKALAFADEITVKLAQSGKRAA